jgi:hypothetical protein
VERWPIDRLIPYAKNSRTHSEAQIAQLAASTKEWGWTNPVLADEAGGVIAGHARILAARQLGIAEVNRANLADAFFAQIIRKYEGTRLGRQEINAEVLDDVPGALWNRGRLEELRWPANRSCRFPSF